ncbi:F-box domain-containing protein [Favolaschia claudopus]|uniref:F-box domain-containing protein n=1 Tax=Favolaschia claudopus TaxID=2862362 RepID=A0AAW0CK97_9AGAR
MLSSLEADRTYILALDAQIEQLEHCPAEKWLKRAEAQARLDAYKYPVLIIPNEIISEIFVQFLPTYPLCPALAGLDSPTLLTHICSQWREVALSTPQLWRAIPLSGYGAGAIHIAKAWLSRAGCCSLSVNIRMQVGRLDDPEYYDVGLLTALISRRAHFEHLTVAGTEMHLPLLDGPLPRLYHLELGRLRYLPATSSGSIGIKLDSEAAPLLRSVVLSDGATLGVEYVELPWEQLTTIALRHGSPDTFCSILQRTLNLIHCDLDFKQRYIRDGFDVLPEVCMPRLRSLILNGPGDRFIGSLVAPTLRSLTVSEQCFTVVGIDPVNLLSAFISKSACELDQLCIVYPNRRNGPFIEMENLHLAFSSIPNIFASPRMRS